MNHKEQARMDRKPKAGSNAPSFFKVLIGDFENQLHVPPAFAKRFACNVPNKFFLTSLTGRSWAVSMKKVDDVFFLCKEWCAFVKDNALELGQFLVFTYCGHSEFSVEIFGRNACKKDVPLANKNKLHCRGLYKTPAKIKNQKPELGRVGRMLEISRERERIIRATRFTSQYPYCSVTLRSTYVDGYCSLVLPRGFARNYLKDASANVTLRLSHGGAKWPAQYSIGTHYKIVTGWKAFVLDNHLKEDDVCIFELVDRDAINLKVTIIRP